MPPTSPFLSFKLPLPPPVQGIKGKSVELLAPNRIVNSAKSSTDLPSHPSTSTSHH